MEEAKSKTPFEIKNHNHDNGYDIIEDYDLIISSFLYQYNIYLPRVRDREMSFREFVYRLGGLDEYSPLSRMARIRLEDDRNVIKHWPDELKAINNAWKVRKTKLMTEEELQRHKEIVQDRLARFFEACAK